MIFLIYCLFSFPQKLKKFTYLLASYLSKLNHNLTLFDVVLEESITVKAFSFIKDACKWFCILRILRTSSNYFRCLFPTEKLCIFENSIRYTFVLVPHTHTHTNTSFVGRVKRKRLSSLFFYLLNCCIILLTISLSQ